MPWPSASDRFASAVVMTTYTAAGARFADGSEVAFGVIVLCTGYRPAVDPLAGHVSFDEAGPVRTDADAACAQSRHGGHRAVRPGRRRAGRRRRA